MKSLFGHAEGKRGRKMGKGGNGERGEDSKNGNNRKETGRRKEGLWQKKSVLKNIQSRRRYRRMKGKVKESLFKTENRGGNMLCFYVSVHCYNCLYGTDGNYKLLVFKRKQNTKKVQTYLGHKDRNLGGSLCWGEVDCFVRENYSIVHEKFPWLPEHTLSIPLPVCITCQLPI